MDFRIYPLKDTSRLPELCDLFAKGLGEITPKEWLWRNFTENGLPEGIVSVAEDENGKLRAVFGMQPVWYRRGQERLMLVQTQGLVIDPECRGQGLMRKVFDYNVDYFRRQGAAALTSFSCNELSYPIFMKYGSADLGALAGLATAKRLICFGKKTAFRRGGWQVEITDEMPRDLFFTESDTVFKMEKNLRFMQWKFTEDPNQRYRWLTIRKGGALEGYFVFYVNQGKLRSAVNICDWELRDSVDAGILKKAVDLLRRMGNWVTLWGIQTEADRSRWCGAGFTQPGTAKDRFVYQPIDSVPPTAWHITKADSDN